MAPTDYIMGGNITRTGTGYALQVSITKSADKMTAASYSGTFTFAELDNLSGVRRASLDLLQKLGVTPTDQARIELTGAAPENHASAQIATARGITARTEVAALSYFIQAATLDSSLTEAANRSLVISANISSGNVGMDTRNDIAWRREWLARLTETEDFFRSMIIDADPPYSLFYSSGIERGAINYQTETTSFSFPINLRANWVWLNSVARAVNTVYAGLTATGKQNEWGFGSWPRQSLSSPNPFSSRYDLSIVFELVNDENKVIGRQTVRLTPSYSFVQRNNEIVSNYDENNFNTVTFNNVKADDISDMITIRIASVNGAAPENARVRIAALPDAKWKEYTQPVLEIKNGLVQGFTRSHRNQIQQLLNLVIPAEFWGEPVTSIGKEAFINNQFTSVTIPDSIKSIGDRAFYNNVPQRNGLTTISIGSDVLIGHESFIIRTSEGYPFKPELNFKGAYYDNNSLAGIYAFAPLPSILGGLSRWNYSPR
ncbi:leucine-rich repeat domain-containing protein [Brucepastera parasyntrophica]|uniref:leucine-rich repeat protein n=1 Tax=Brucepastera parasyntrophica TaxID=2880008 RepID=UPI00210BD0D0|nr:leucine-rich repeat protein [Brucepastera parasyntrophica]ULQ61010.1 leucine-rich repeat domain-containing protein [Brucepastera parasyntrophica]